MFDFVRLQVAVALLAILVIGLLARAWRSRTGAVTLSACAVLAGYQASWLHPYSPIATPMAVTDRSCPPGAAFTVMVANVKKGNRNFEAFRAVVETADPDILLALETDQWWDKQLAALDDRYQASVESVPKAAEYFGLHLFSKFPLDESAIEFWFGEDTPAVSAEVKLPTGTFRFVGIHPRPPQSFEQPTTLRDGTLAHVALEAAETVFPIVVAGDFNAVSWERTYRRMMRVGGLLDPTVGRGFFATYDATNPIMAWPLDHILFQAGIGLRDFETLPFIDSDHYPVMAKLCLNPEMASRQSAPTERADDREELRQAVQSARRLGTP
ncbi:endonuclease/exonuclease/phosphatase family protein [Aurantimonas sp. A2-1-M11]|uniref:endonuclease/exonuclease/phosphatase family protein n=1 Tax=Aurantimonas sp. A2-1-M11 TaxID=3113712 RepID=UPI002F935562